jgi:hypothetical protein
LGHFVSNFLMIARLSFKIVPSSNFMLGMIILGLMRANHWQNNMTMEMMSRSRVLGR